MKSKTAVLFCFICLFAFTLLSKYEDRALLRNIDLAVTVKLQDKIDKSMHLRLTAFVDNTMEGATYFASPEFTSIVVLLLTAAVVYDRKKKRIRWSALVIPTAFVFILCVEIFGKTVVHHPSPPFAMIKHPTSIFPANYVNEQFSYPSGHAARAIFVAIVVSSVFMIQYSLFKSRWIKVITITGLIAYVLLVCASRIYLGHHWFSDVVGGTLVGLAGASFTLASFPLVDGHHRDLYNRQTMSD